MKPRTIVSIECPECLLTTVLLDTPENKDKDISEPRRTDCSGCDAIIDLPRVAIMRPKVGEPAPEPED